VCCREAIVRRLTGEPPAQVDLACSWRRSARRQVRTLFRVAKTFEIGIACDWDLAHSEPPSAEDAPSRPKSHPLAPYTFRGAVSAAAWRSPAHRQVSSRTGRMPALLPGYSISPRRRARFENWRALPGDHRRVANRPSPGVKAIGLRVVEDER